MTGKDIGHSLYAIRSASGKYYKPGYGPQIWSESILKAKIYTRESHAKNAIRYHGFRDCEIVEIGTVVPSSSLITLQGG